MSPLFTTGYRQAMSSPGIKKQRPQPAPSLASTDFFAFAKRLGYDYDNKYSYLRYPAECLLAGESIDCMKGSQVGLTQLILNYAFYAQVVKQKSIFYMLPTDAECTDFSSARFNVLVAADDEISACFNADNVHHKRYKSSNLYVRGAQNNSKRKSKIKSVPVQILILDELDEISEDTQEQVEERLSGSLDKQRIRISTPSLSDRGIAKCWANGWQHNYMLTCLHCGREQCLTLEDNADTESKSYVCAHCRKPWTHDNKIEMLKRGRWIAGERNGDTKCFFVSQLYSPTVTAEELIAKLLAADNDVKKQAFHNHKLGLPYSAEGSKLSEDKVYARVTDINVAGLQMVAGVDIGYTWHNVVIAAAHPVGPVIVRIAKVGSWPEIEALFKLYDVKTFVVDSAPERSRARELVRDSASVGYMAQYPNGIKVLYTKDEDETKRFVKIGRTEVIDVVLDRFRQDTVALLDCPGVTANIDEYAKHLCSVSRLYREVSGEVEAYYEESGPDHYLHATAYMEIAYKINGTRTNEGVAGSFI